MQLLHVSGAERCSFPALKDRMRRLIPQWAHIIVELHPCVPRIPVYLIMMLGNGM